MTDNKKPEIADEPRKRTFEGFTFETSAGYNVTRTKPEFLLRHDISDEELSLVANGNRSFMHDVLWVSLGTFLGALAPAISAIATLNAEKSAFGNLELVECLICGGGFFVFVSMVLVLSNTPNISKNLAETIRERTAA